MPPKTHRILVKEDKSSKLTYTDVDLNIDAESKHVNEGDSIKWKAIGKSGEDRGITVTFPDTAPVDPHQVTAAKGKWTDPIKALTQGIAKHEYTVTLDSGTSKDPDIIIDPPGGETLCLPIGLPVKLLKPIKKKLQTTEGRSVSISLVNKTGKKIKGFSVEFTPFSPETEYERPIRSIEGTLRTPFVPLKVIPKAGTRTYPFVIRIPEIGDYPGELVVNRIKGKPPLKQAVKAKKLRR